MRAIDADELKEVLHTMQILQTVGCQYNIIDVIDNMKTLESSPKGKWILQSRTPGFFGRDDVDNFKCSVCGKITCHTYAGVVENEITPYCPQCGASMSKDIERMF